MSGMDNTSSFDTGIDLTSENRKVEQFSDDVSRSAPELEDAPVAPKQDEAPGRPVDPRAQQLEEIARNRNEQRNNELATEDERFGRQRDAAPAAPPAEDDYVDLKVRKQTQRMTVKERDEILADDFDRADIGAMTEAERNRNAQMILAQRAYRQEIDDLKQQVKNPHTVIQQAAPQAEAAPQELPKTPREIAEGKLDKALEALEFGEEGARARVIEAQKELSKIEAHEALQQTRFADASNAYDADTNAGWVETTKDEVFQKNVLAVGALEKATDIGMRKMIANYLNSQPQHVQAAFMRSGVTPEYLANARPEHIARTYKDMSVKGYPVPKPSALIQAVGQYVSSQFAGDTSPAAQGQHQGTDAQDGAYGGVDRSDRKAAIVNQPPRAGVPRPAQGNAAPPMTEQERAKATIQSEKLKRRGVPVR